MSYFGTTEYLLEVARGNIPGQSLKLAVAHNGTVGTVAETLWEEGGVYAMPATASTMTVSSDDANDTSAGTGARKVLIQGLDTNWAEISETIILNGTTAVTTVNSYLRVSNGAMEVTEAGTSLNNEGNIYIGTGTVTAGKPAVVYGLIDPTASISHVGVLSIPANKTGYLTKLIFTVDANRSAEIFFYTRDNAVATNPWIERTSFDIISATAPEPGFGLTFPEKTDIRVDGVLSASTGKLKLTCLVLMIDN